MFRRIFFQRFLFSFAFFAPLVFLGPYLLTYKSLTGYQTAFVLLVASLSARLSRLAFMGILHKANLNVLMASAYTLGGIGILAMAYFDSIYLLFFGVMCIGIFYSTASVIVQVLISFHSKDRLVDFARAHTITNVASMLGPVGFNALYSLQFDLPFYVWGIYMLACACYSLVVKIKFVIPAQEHSSRSLIYLLKNANAMLIAVCILTGWLFYNTVMTFSSISIARFFGLEEYIWTIATCNGLVVALFGILTNKFLKRRLKNPYQNTILGYLLFATCFVALYFLPLTVSSLLLAVVLVSVAELIIVPGWQNLTATLIGQEYRVAMISLTVVFFAGGESIGQAIGVLIADNFVAALISNHGFIVLAGIAVLLVLVLLKKIARMNHHQLKTRDNLA